MKRSARPQSVPRRRYWRANAVAIAVAGSLLVAACGGSTDTNAAGPTPEPATAVGPTSAPADSNAPNSSSTDTSDGGEIGSADGAQSPAGVDPTAVEDRPAMLRLEGADLTGVSFDNVAYAGQDVLLWFWAPW